MKPTKYSLVAMIHGQEFTSKNNTLSEYKRLVKMIYSFGGYLVEVMEEEVL